MRFLICVFAIVLFCVYDVEGMTRTQLKKTLGVPKRTCMSKNGVAEDKVGKIDQGVFIEERNVMCYITCVFKSLQVMKNDRLVKALVIKQVDALYPVEMRPFVKKGVDSCFDVQNEYTDSCEGVFYSTKCLYEFDPENFVFA